MCNSCVSHGTGCQWRTKQTSGYVLDCLTQGTWTWLILSRTRVTHPNQLQVLHCKQDPEAEGASSALFIFSFIPVLGSDFENLSCLVTTICCSAFVQLPLSCSSLPLWFYGDPRMTARQRLRLTALRPDCFISLLETSGLYPFSAEMGDRVSLAVCMRTAGVLRGHAYRGSLTCCAPPALEGARLDAEYMKE